ncbi:Leucine-rich repeats and immunoglobulin-like domains protein 2 [Liparis tanakae]|nr:Leucine-rich repeats and immunoglobulin-like domains protein 2 [Liparis tanakae]
MVNKVPLGVAVKMALGVLLLLLLNTSACGGFGFKSCSLNFPTPDLIWCFDQNIVNLTAVLRTLPDNATAINLSKNRIGAVPPASFSRMPGLKLLDLSQNRLVSLRGGGFRGLEVLESLNLTCNNISRLHAGAFEGLAGLQTLLLTHNALAAFPPSLFGSLPAILDVRLSLNRLTAFGCEASGGSATLRRLDLVLNDLRRLNVSCFPALRSIGLSNNSRLALRPDAFASNPRLRTLLGRGVRTEVLMGLSAETRRNLTWVAFSLSLEKSPVTICGVLRGMERLQRVEVQRVS